MNDIPNNAKEDLDGAASTRASRYKQSKTYSSWIYGAVRDGVLSALANHDRAFFGKFKVKFGTMRGQLLR